eukprot:233121_1
MNKIIKEKHIIHWSPQHSQSILSGCNELPNAVLDIIKSFCITGSTAFDIDSTKQLLRTQMCSKWYFHIGKDRVWCNGNALRVVLLATTKDSSAQSIVSGFYRDFETPQLQLTYLHRSMTIDKEHDVRINIAHTDIAMHKVYQSN